MTFTESELLFDFSDKTWSYLMQYDEESDFFKIRDAVKGTKAVDFIGVFDEKNLAIIDVKNFRGYRIENKSRLENGEDSLDMEVAKKVRDTIAGIAGAAINSTHKADYWQKYLSFFQHKKRIEVILWLEEDQDPRPIALQQKRSKSRGGTLTQRLKNNLKWLTPYVQVVSIQENHLKNVEVNYL